jgi:16S rRNA (adenine1518-N6/adenine1519-N6)-dimethyltransferase
VPASSFRPPPNVDSAIVKLVVRDKPLFDIDDKAFFRLVKAGFGEKRKMLRNSLSGGLGLEQAKVSSRFARDASLRIVD